MNTCGTSPYRIASSPFMICSYRSYHLPGGARLASFARPSRRSPTLNRCSKYKSSRCANRIWLFFYHKLYFFWTSFTIGLDSEAEGSPTGEFFGVG